MPPQENQFFSEVISEPIVMLHVFGNPANEFVKNMGIMHARNQAKAGYEAPIPLIHKYALVHPGGLWTFHEDLSDISLAKGPKLDLTQAIVKMKELQVVVAEVHVHTTVRNYKALFELLEIPIIGTGAEASANVADKATTRGLLLQAGVKVPKGTILHQSTFLSSDFSTEVLLESHGLQYPLVVKPSRMEASRGVSLVHDQVQMISALLTAFSYGDTVIIDTFIPGREIRGGILCRKEGMLERLPLMEYRMEPHEIRGLDRKVEKDGKAMVSHSFHYIHPEDDPILHERMHQVFCKAHTALGCRDFSFTDCRVTEDGEIFVLEMNVFAAFNPGSVMTKLTNAAGISHNQFWGSMVTKVVDRRRDVGIRCTTGA